MKRLLLLITIISLIGCKTNENSVDVDTDIVKDSLTDSERLSDSLDKEIISDYDMSMVDKENQTAFKENLVKIEKEHGAQWDFCTCVVKNDSINKAFAQPVSDQTFDKLSDRFDEIDKHCKAFLAQNPNQTPEERIKHEKKVKKCLKAAGIK